MKMLVEVRLNVPLLRGSKIKMANEKHSVDFKYEQLPVFCFYCEVIGYQDRSYELKVNDAKEGRSLKGNMHGEWISVSLPMGGEKGLQGRALKVS